MVLPVVARKKGLDEYYETADGSPQPKKPEKMVAPVRPLIFELVYPDSYYSLS